MEFVKLLASLRHNRDSSHRAALRRIREECIDLGCSIVESDESAEVIEGLIDLDERFDILAIQAIRMRQLAPELMDEIEDSVRKWRLALDNQFGGYAGSVEIVKSYDRRQDSWYLGLEESEGA